MSKKKLAIIGNGMGTCRLLDELASRGAAFQYEITVFGEEQGGAYNRIMLGKVLCGILEEDYPSSDPARTYVGRCFALTLTESKRGRNGGNYNTYNVAEIEDPTPKADNGKKK